MAMTSDDATRCTVIWAKAARRTLQVSPDGCLACMPTGDISTAWSRPNHGEWVRRMADQGIFMPAYPADLSKAEGPKNNQR